MKISSGMSEISINTYNNGKVNTEKISVWPVYDAGVVNKIQGVVKWTDTNAAYFKPSEEEKEKIMNSYFQDKEQSYNRKGSVTSMSNIVRPGSLFDAIV